MKVFCLHYAYGSGDSETEYALQSVCSTIEIAKMEAKKALSAFENGNYDIEPMNKEMSKENDYVFIGSRKEADETECGVDYNVYGGFVIEETEVL